MTKLLPPETRETALAELDRWTLSADGKAITRNLTFPDFAAAFSFMTRVALHAEKHDHHPEWTNVWNRVDVRLSTHDADGLTRKDLELAHFIDKLNPAG